MKKFLKALSTLAAGLLATASFATQTVNLGNNPTLGLNGIPGLIQSIGTPPNATTSTCASGTSVATGGAFAGIVTTTTCTTFVGVLIWSIPALGSGATDGGAGSGYSPSVFAPVIHGGVCRLFDETTPADNTVASGSNDAIAVYVAPTATAPGTITCTFATKTIAAADTLAYTLFLY